ncbi:MAG: hypothetical protein HC815_27355 [Richelia sp. RM1_1_1]|nr:hypothetical protein [Richelia sp. RM1_1_1]
MNEKFVQLEIWDLLDEAKQEPLEVNWNLLWDSLDFSLIDLEVSQQLQVASEALLQMVEVFHIRSMEAFEELEAYTSDDGPVMGNVDFVPFVRQFIDIDFDEFIEPLVSSIRKPYTLKEGDECQSQVEVIDKQVLLEATQQVPEVADRSVIEVAHSENVSDWIKAITNYFVTTSVKLTTWSELCQKLDITPVEILLGLLLGNFALRQTLEESSSFYDSEILIETC